MQKALPNFRMQGSLNEKVMSSRTELITHFEKMIRRLVSKSRTAMNTSMSEY
jgi:hypothetical protein